MSFSIYLYKDFIEVPFPITGVHTPCLKLFDLTWELRAKFVPAVSNRFIAYIYPTFMKQVFYISQSKWKSHIQHDCKLNNLWTGFKMAK